MASPESKRLLESFASDESGRETSVEEERAAWEAAVEKINRQLTVNVTAVDIDGIPGEWIADEVPPFDRAHLFFHGGGYNAGSPRTHRDLAARLFRSSGVPVLLIDYRLAPEHPAPAAVDDAVTALHWLQRQGVPADRLVVGGDSAGGGLALALLNRIARSGGKQPAAAVFLSPWLDLTLSGSTMTTHATTDPLTSYHDLRKAANLYATTLSADHEDVSPLFCDPTGFPPLLIHVGGLEVLLSDSTRLAERAQTADVPVELKIWNDLWHVFQVWAAELPEGQASIGEIGAFIARSVTKR
jgi:monoterpene epsilon-lactone hydrolase